MHKVSLFVWEELGRIKRLYSHGVIALKCIRVHLQQTETLFCVTCSTFFTIDVNFSRNRTLMWTKKHPKGQDETPKQQQHFTMSAQFQALRNPNLLLFPSLLSLQLLFAIHIWSKEPVADRVGKTGKQVRHQVSKTGFNFMLRAKYHSTVLMYVFLGSCRLIYCSLKNQKLVCSFCLLLCCAPAKGQLWSADL